MKLRAGWMMMRMAVAAAVVCVAAGSAQTVWDGTADTSWYSASETEFTITTAEQFAGFAMLVNRDKNNTDMRGKTIKLGNHIALNDTANWERWSDSVAPANKWTPIGNSNQRHHSYFSGTFDGAGFAVSGVYVNNGNDVYAGLFGYVSSGTIKNLGIVALYVHGGEDVYSVGGLAGQLSDGGLITNCYAEVNVVGGNAITVGGLVGEIGRYDKITNSYVTGNVWGDSLAMLGGFVGGSNEGYVENSYAIVNVSSGKWTGGFVGGSRGIPFKSCYYRDDTNSPSKDTYNSAPKTTEEMKQQSTYAGWDFDSVWVMSEYPILQVQQMPPTVAVSSPARVIPAARPADESVSISPVSPLTAVFTAGPNPASKSSGKVIFYRNGAILKGASLHIYDASGNFVASVNSGAWDLRDAKGRSVPAGTYLVRGAVKAKGGKQERVSAVVGVK